MASEAASLGLEVNWQKTKIQALGCREDMPLTIKVQGQDVMVVEEFVYLGSLIHSTTVSLPSGRLEKTTRSSPHHVAQNRPTGSETTPPYAPRSSRFGSETLSVEDDVDVWRYAIMSCMPETTTNVMLAVTMWWNYPWHTTFGIGYTVCTHMHCLGKQPFAVHETGVWISTLNVSSRYK